MPARRKYDTRQRKLILNYLIENSERPLTVEMISNALSGNVGQTTVYRNLDCLAREKVIMKVDIPDGKGAYFQYISGSYEKSCHLFCTGCGKITDMDCDFVVDLSDHVRQEHQFRLDNSETVLRGKCEQCLEMA